jgi:hypothetical protein
MVRAIMLCWAKIANALVAEITTNRTAAGIAQQCFSARLAHPRCLQGTLRLGSVRTALGRVQLHQDLPGPHHFTITHMDGAQQAAI